MRTVVLFCGVFLIGCAAHSPASQTRDSGDTRRIASAIPGDAALASLVIGVSPDILTNGGKGWDKDISRAGVPAVRAAAEKCRDNPARATDVSDRVPGADTIATADLNADGVVTIDEIVALSDAGLNDGRIVERLRGSGCQFELQATQKSKLKSGGVSDRIIAAMEEMSGGPRSATATPEAKPSATPSDAARLATERIEAESARPASQ